MVNEELVEVGEAAHPPDAKEPAWRSRSNRRKQRGVVHLSERPSASFCKAARRTGHNATRCRTVVVFANEEARPRSCVVHDPRSVGASQPSSLMRSHNCSGSMASKERSVIGSPTPIHHRECDDGVVTPHARLPDRERSARRQPPSSCVARTQDTQKDWTTNRRDHTHTHTAPPPSAHTRVKMTRRAS